MFKSELNDFSPYALTCRRPLKAGRADLVRSALVQRPCLRELRQDETRGPNKRCSVPRQMPVVGRIGHAPLDNQSLHSGPRHILPPYCGLLRARRKWPKNGRCGHCAANKRDEVAPTHAPKASLLQSPKPSTLWPARNKGHRRPFADATLTCLATRTEPGANRLPLRADRKLGKAFYVHIPQY